MILTTIASAIVGLVGSALPEVASHLKKKEDHKFELELLKFQASSTEAAAVATSRAKQSEVLADEMKAIYRDATTKHSYRWVDAIYKLTRPWITLVIVAQWVLVNCAEMWWLVENQGTWTAVTQAWSEFDQAIMTTVIMFWFGHRAMMRTHRRTT